MDKEEFMGYADLEGDNPNKGDFKKRQMSCYVKDLPKDEIPDSLKSDDKPKARRMSCVQMLK